MFIASALSAKKGNLIAKNVMDTSLQIVKGSLSA